MAEQAGSNTRVSAERHYSRDFHYVWMARVNARMAMKQAETPRMAEQAASNTRDLLERQAMRGSTRLVPTQDQLECASETLQADSNTRVSVERHYSLSLSRHCRRGNTCR
jgi:hypothetical protein